MNFVDAAMNAARFKEERDAAEVRREQSTMHAMILERGLAECYRLTGSDPDGDSDAHLAKEAVQAVKELREEHDAETESLEKDATEWEDRALTAESALMDLEASLDKKAEANKEVKP